MKPFLVAVIFAIAGGVAADPPSLTGEWKLHNNVFGNETDRTCTFEQQQQELKGTCTDGQVTVAAIGTVEGKKVTMRLQTKEGNDTVTLDYTGTLVADDKVLGTVTVVEAGVDGDFIATRAK
jgi:hypothetical protein